MEVNHQLSDKEAQMIYWMMIYAIIHPETFPELQIQES